MKRYPKIGDVLTVQGIDWEIDRIYKSPGGRIDFYGVTGVESRLENVFTRKELGLA